MDTPNRFDENIETLVRKITLSQGLFATQLLLCDYKDLQEQILGRLKDRLTEEHLSLKALKLSKTTLQRFESVNQIIKAVDRLKQSEENVSALFIWGFDSCDENESFLSKANIYRDYFSEQFKFPLIFCVSSKNLANFSQFAPDFKNWLGVPLVFEKSSEQLINFFEGESEKLFSRALETGSEIPKSSQKNLQAVIAYQKLKRWGNLTPMVEAASNFVLGQQDYINDDIDNAIVKYELSLQYWEQAGNHEYCGVLQFYLALCYRRKAEKERINERELLKKEEQYIKECLKQFQEAQRDALRANFIDAHQQVLERLANLKEKEENDSKQQLDEQEKLLDELEKISKEAEELHKHCGEKYKNKLANDYGFLATVALKKANLLSDQKEKTRKWEEAKKYAEEALEIAQKAWFYLLLAQASDKLGNEQTLNYLQKAKEKSDPSYNIHLHIKILRELRQYYFEKHKYLEAFQERMERQKIEWQYGLRAFIGAASLEPEPVQKVAPVIMSSRDKELEDIKKRFEEDRSKLTVIHGPSGVGKSSLIKVGLIPCLKNDLNLGESRHFLPILIDNYSDKLCETIIESFNKEIESFNKERKSPTISLSNMNSLDNVLEEFKNNCENKIRVVLIFDQFEDFFFDIKELEKKRGFLKFLAEAISINNVYVLLSLRTDYIHCLLEGQNLIKTKPESEQKPFKKDILDSNIRCELGNFSKNNARKVVDGLKESSQLQLDDDLVEEVINDLAKDNNNEVRPIELQIVGFQLQELGISSKKEYEKRYEEYKEKEGENPKDTFINRYIKDIVRDCGSLGEENSLAMVILYLLTDEKIKRPLRSQEELKEKLKNPNEDEKLEKILDIFVASGLVKLLQNTEKQYQLVHEYLVPLIRNYITNEDIQEQIATLKTVKQDLENTKQDLENTKQNTKKVIGISVIAAFIIMSIAAILTNRSMNAAKLERDLVKLDIETQNLSTGANVTFYPLLMDSLKYKKKITLDSSLNSQLRYPWSNLISIVEQQIINKNQDKFFIYSKESIKNWSLSSDGKWLAGIFRDQNITIWNLVSKQLYNLPIKQNVSRLWFNPSPPSKQASNLVIYFEGSTSSLYNCSITEYLLKNNSFSLKKCDDLSVIVQDKDEKPSSIRLSESGNRLVAVFLGSSDKTEIALWHKVDKLWKFKQSWKLSNIADVGILEDQKSEKLLIVNKEAKHFILEPIQIEQLQSSIPLHTERRRIYFVGLCSGNKVFSYIDEKNRLSLDNGENKKSTPLNLKSGVESISCSENGNKIAIAYLDGSFLITDITAKNNSTNEHDKSSNQAILDDIKDEIKKSKNGSQDITEIVFNDQTKTFAFSIDNKVFLCNNKTLTPCKSLPGFNTQQTILSLDWSRDGNYLAMGSNNGEVFVWDVKKNQEAWNKTIGNKPILGISLSADNQRLAIASEDGSVKVLEWQSKKAPEPQTYPNPNSNNVTARSLSFNPKNSQQLVVAYDNGTVKQIDTSTQSNDKPKTLIQNLKHFLLMLSPANQDTSTQGNDKPKTKTLIEGLDSRQVSSMSFSPDGKYIATLLVLSESSSQDRENFQVRVWDVENKKDKALALVDFPPIESEKVSGINFIEEKNELKLVVTNKNGENQTYTVDNLDSLQQKTCNFLKDYHQLLTKYKEANKSASDEELLKACNP